METSVLGTSLVNLVFLFVGVAPIVYYVTNALKGLTNAYIYDKKKEEKDPWWYQSLWRLVPLLLGGLIGLLLDQTEYYNLPAGTIAGVLSGVFCVLLYRKIRDTLASADLTKIVGGGKGKGGDSNY